jgi:hypothetical protein
MALVFAWYTIVFENCRDISWRGFLSIINAEGLNDWQTLWNLDIKYRAFARQ